MGRAKKKASKKRAVPVKESKGLVRSTNRKKGTAKKHPYNKGRKDDLSDDQCNEEAIAAVAASRNATALDLQPVVSEDELHEGVSPRFNTAAAALGLNRKQVSAAMVLALGYPTAQAAANAGVVERTIRTWMRSPSFKSFVDELTLASTETVRAEALRQLSAQLRKDGSQKDSEKDIFDWVKLGIGVSGSSRSPKEAAGPASQHIHFHSNENVAESKRGQDDSTLITLQRRVAPLSGSKRRKLAELLRNEDG